MDVKTAVIAPTKYLEEWSNSSLCWCFASRAYQDPVYLRYHREAKHRGTKVVLDHHNLVPRKPVTYKVWIEMIGRIDPDYVVLPDADFSAKRTVIDSTKYHRRYCTLRQFKGISLIGMLQGTTLVELDRCYQHLRPIVDVIGLPCSNERIMPRGEILDRLDITQDVIFYEILKDPMDELPQDPRVWAFVTSWPVRLGLSMRTLDEYEPSPKPLDLGLRTVNKLRRNMVMQNIDELIMRSKA